MKHPARFLLGAVLALVSACSLSADPLHDSFREPAAEARPFVRWWWSGSRINEKEIVRELDVMHAAGIGGVEINTIGEAPGSDPATLANHPVVPWLSPEWSRLVAVAADEARARGMTADLLVGSGWPFGGRFLEPHEQTQRIRLGRKSFRGPRDVNLTRGELLKIQHVLEKKRGEDEMQPSRSELVFLRLVPADTRNGAFNPGKELLGDRGDSDQIKIHVPAGEFHLYVGVWDMGFTEVKNGAPGADGPAVNHFDAGAVRKYLDLMAGKLAPAMGGRLGNKLRAVFVDSLELDHANWTGDFPQEFTKRRGYDLLPYLPFVLEGDRAGSATPFDEVVRRAHYDFSRTIVELFHERFLATYVSWAHSQGLKARIQAYGREAHPLEGSMQVDLPEGETWLWRNKDMRSRILVESTTANKYVASAANLTGQRLRSFEAMTNSVPVFWETLRDFKRATDLTFVSGLNHAIIHGYNYTPLDAGYPGWVRYGNYLNERTPWWPYFRRYSDYHARMSAVLRRTVAPARIAVLAPRPDEWAKHGLLYQPFPETADPWYQFKLIDAIQQAGYNADYVSENVLIDAKKEGAQLRFGPCAYDLLVVEDVLSMEPRAADALADYVAAGGRVVFIGQRPSQAPGLFQAEARNAHVKAALARVAQANGGAVRDERAPADGKNDIAREKILVRFATEMLGRTGLTPDVKFANPQRTVSQIHQRDGERALYFIANSDEDAAAQVEASFPGAKGRPYVWDPETGGRKPLELSQGGTTSLQLPPLGSALIVFEPAETPAAGNTPRDAATREIGRVEGPWKATFTTAGTAETFERQLNVLEDLSQKSKDDDVHGFGGTITYRATFEAKEVSGPVTLDLGLVFDTSEVILNGEPLGSRWWGDHRYDVTGKLRAGKNQIKVTVTTALANQMRELKGNTSANRWAWWAPPIRMGLVGPVRLVQAAHR